MRRLELLTSTVSSVTSWDLTLVEVSNAADFAVLMPPFYGMEHVSLNRRRIKVRLASDASSTRRSSLVIAELMMLFMAVLIFEINILPKRQASLSSNPYGI